MDPLEPDDMHGHVIVCGLQGVGLRARWSSSLSVAHRSSSLATTPIHASPGPSMSGASHTSDATPTGVRDSRRPGCARPHPLSASRSTRSTRSRQRSVSRKCGRISPSWCSWPIPRRPPRWNGSPGALAVVGTLLFLLIVAATVVVHFAFRPGPGQAHLGLLSSLYFTVETVATVGYGDDSFARQSPWLLVCGIMLIIAGVALVSTAFALFTHILVSRRIERSLG